MVWIVRPASQAQEPFIRHVILILTSIASNPMQITIAYSAIYREFFIMTLIANLVLALLELLWSLLVNATLNLVIAMVMMEKVVLAASKTPTGLVLHAIIPVIVGTVITIRHSVLLNVIPAP